MADTIRQLLSQTSYVADGSQTVWNFSFSGGYIDKSHVKAKYLDAARVEHQIAVTPGMFLGQYQLNITPPIAAGSELVIYRDTPKEGPLVDFADSAALTEQALDLNAKQAVFVAAESSDGWTTIIEATNSDRLQTGEDRTAARDSAANALVSENVAGDKADEASGHANAASGQAALATNAAATTQTLRDSIITTQGSIGYLPPVAYAAGLSMTLPAQTVSYAGQAYAPLLSALPFTTSGTFETAKFRLIQGVAAVDLAAAGGAGMVGYDGGTVAGFLGTQLGRVVESIALLRTVDKTRAQNAVVVGYYTRGDGGGGVYYYDAIDTTTPDNGGTVIVAADSARWKLAHQGEVSILQFGFVADYNAGSGTSNKAKLLAMVADTNIDKIVGAQGNYWFGLIVGNTTLCTVSRPMVIDWNGAELFAGETNPTAMNTGTGFICATNTGSFHMGNYGFTDTTFAYVNNSRGIQPASILNTGTSVTYGYTLGPFYIRAGQSLLTAYSSNPGVAIAKQIGFVGACRGGQVYYGVNLAYSGDQFTGNYTLDNVHRALFVYDVEDIDVVFHAKNNEPTSACLLVSSKGTRTTRNVKVRGTFDIVNGGVLVTCLSTEAGSFSNIDIDVHVKTAGTNANSGNSLVRVGVQSPAGNWVADHTYSVQGLKVRARSDFKYAGGNLAVMTASPNIGAIAYEGGPLLSHINSGDVHTAGTHFLGAGNSVVVGNIGDLTTTPVKLNLAKFRPSGPNTILGTLLVSTLKSDTLYCIKEYRVSGPLGSDGTHGVLSSTLINTHQAGAYNPTLTLSSDYYTWNVGASAGGDAAAITEIRFTPALLGW